jgi:hypothetical protein
MSWKTDLLYSAIRTFLYQKALQRVKQKGLLVYLKTLQVLRKSLALSLLVFFTLQLMLVGFVGSLTIGIWLIPTTPETKLWILLATFGTLFLIPALILTYILSEKFWFKASGAQKIIKDQNKNN